MQFKSMDSWKTQMKRRAAEKNVDVTDMQQRYILEEFASKIGHSEHKNNFVLKGGFIVSNLLGIDWRTTRDIDMTFQSTIYSEEEIRKILMDVINTDVNSFFTYEIDNIKEGQVDDGYSGFNVTINAIHGKTKLPLKLDISNNMLIYPQAIENTFKSIFDDKEIQVMSYSIENIIAEKFETTLDCGEYNTRMRDLFDIALLMESQKHLIDNTLLVECIIEVSKERNTLENLNEFNEIIEELSTSEILIKILINIKTIHIQYKNNTYTESTLTLKDIFDIFRTIQSDIKRHLEHLESDRKPALDDKLTLAKQNRNANDKGTYKYDIENELL